MTTFPYVELDCLCLDRAVIELLPPEIAYRYHALPVATDGSKVTVAMAKPDDQAAFSAIQSIIHAPLCLIRADEEEIDHRLGEVWPVMPEQMKFLFWPLTKESDRSFNIAKGIARSLRAKLLRSEYPGNGQNSIIHLHEAITLEEPDLLIIEADHPSKLCREVSGWNENDLEAEQLDLLILPPEPTLPIKKLLVVLPDNGLGCEKAGSWIIRFSQSRRIDVTILPVLPPIPLCYGTFLRYNLAALLAGSDVLGKNLRLLSNRISRENITANYKLREGDAFSQIRDEISTLDPDLIIMPSSPQQGRSFWFCTDLAGMLFKFITKPILVLNQN